MNSCILMAELISDPQLRYTADSQIPIAEMQIQFPNLGNDSRPAILRAIVWGKQGEEVSQKYRAGDRVIIEGRLSMNLIQRQEGFKEKRAELTASKIYSLEFEGQDDSQNRVSNRDYGRGVSQPQEERDYNSNVVSMESRRSAAGTQGGRDNSDRFADGDDNFYGSSTMESSASEEDEQADDYDPIPF